MTRRPLPDTRPSVLRDASSSTWTVPEATPARLIAIGADPVTLAQVPSNVSRTHRPVIVVPVSSLLDPLPASEELDCAGGP